jgi:lipopolysaccharide/colanic/teichoic acid biosynthesis glycosyltransferase
VLFFIWPVLLVAAIVVKLTSPGPVFFLQERTGRDGRPFRIFKFRTMETGAEKKGLGFEVLEGDSRITPVGSFLRRWSIDELPQLFNVLRGDMSLVGPRPTLKYQTDAYDDFQKRRLLLKPGMTGLATVSGRNMISWNERIELDVRYVDNYSLWLDIRIMLATFGTIFKGEGIYADSLDKLRVKPSQKPGQEEDSGRES